MPVRKQEGRKKTSSQAWRTLEGHICLQKSLSCSSTQVPLSCTEPTCLLVRSSAVSGELVCPRNVAGTPAGDSRPWSDSKSGNFSSLLQINRVFAGIFLNGRSQATSGLLNICLQMWIIVPVNTVSESHGMRRLCLNLYLCYFQATWTSCWCDCRL